MNCSAAKADRRARAEDLYTGSFFQLAKRAAWKLNPGVIKIISARWGLIDPLDWIDPYDTRLGDPEAITVDRFAQTVAQHLDHQLAGGQVVALTTLAYTNLARTVWPALNAPLEGLGGIGRMRSALSTIIATGQLPPNNDNDPSRT